MMFMALYSFKRALFLQLRIDSGRPLHWDGVVSIQWKNQPSSFNSLPNMHLAYTWKYFQFHLKPAVPIETTDLFELIDASGSGETDSSTSISSSASEQQDPPAITQRDECDDEVFGALHRSMWHVSMEAPPREQSGLKPMHCEGSDVAAKGYCGGPPGQSQIMSDKEKCFSIRHWLNWETDAVSLTTRYEKIL